MLKSKPAMGKPLHIFAVILFALTQCFAPFVHAHVNGVESNTAIHVHDIPHLSSPTKLLCPCIESQESQAISIAHEYQRDMTFVIPDTNHSTTHPSSPGIAGATAEPHYVLRAVALSFKKPRAQAPPLSSHLIYQLPSINV